jgi:hypothetical protein
MLSAVSCQRLQTAPCREWIGHICNDLCPLGALRLTIVLPLNHAAYAILRQSPRLEESSRERSQDLCGDATLSTRRAIRSGFHSFDARRHPLRRTYPKDVGAGPTLRFAASWRSRKVRVPKRTISFCLRRISVTSTSICTPNSRGTSWTSAGC